MKNFRNLAVGSIVYGAAGKSAKVLSIDGEQLTIDTPAGVRIISLVKVAKVEPPATQAFHVGDRVTLLDKYQVRAADIGTVEGFTDLGIQILWDNNSPHEPNLKQPPIAWRTFRADELELVEPMYQQN
jgi:hypothetical protein